MVSFYEHRFLFNPPNNIAMISNDNEVENVYDVELDNLIENIHQYSL